MISYIHGTLADKNFPYIVVEANGIGYQIEVSLFTFEQLQTIGDKVQVVTHLVVREDAHLLYGFSNLEEKDMFTAIIKVSGFGPRIAMSMLSSCRPGEISNAIGQANKDFLKKIPGIGAKSAEMLILKLRDKVLPGDDNSAVAVSSSVSDAEAALQHLGYRAADIQKILRQLPPDNDTANLVRLALRQLSPVKQ